MIIDKQDVQIELIRQIQVFGDALNVRWQSITQYFDEQYPELSDEDFAIVKAWAIELTNEAKSAAIQIIWGDK
jgi:hypothetical protein